MYNAALHCNHTEWWWISPFSSSDNYASFVLFQKHMNKSSKTASAVSHQCVLFNLFYNYFSLLQNNFLFEKSCPTNVLIFSFFFNSGNWVFWGLLKNDSICPWRRTKVPCPHFHYIALYKDPKVPHIQYFQNNFLEQTGWVIHKMSFMHGK